MASVWEKSCLLKCFNWKCPMVHHRHTNCSLFRCCSIFASWECTNSLSLCWTCTSMLGDDSWKEVSSWSETVNTRTGKVVSSTHDSQQAGQATCYLCYLIAFPLAMLVSFLLGSFFYLLSLPGLCLGDGAVPEEEGSSRCFTKREMALRFSSENYGQCECCCLACYRGPKNNNDLEMNDVP